jgi:histidine ammonia-lyase
MDYHLSKHSRPALGNGGLIPLPLLQVRHLNAGFGDTLPVPVSRAVMLVRANSLSRGYSGVRPAVVRLVRDMLNADVVPLMPQRGSVSASGDLMPISYLASCMSGRPDAKVGLSCFAFFANCLS